MVLLMFFEALYFGHFLSFYTMQLEPPKCAPLPSPPPFPPPPRSSKRLRKGYQRPHRPPAPLRSELRFLSHHLQKKPIVSSQILRDLKNDFDILFLQEINHTPILPHVYIYGSGTNLGGSSCMVKNEGKGRKMTGFQMHQKIVVLMDILKLSQTSMAE